MEPFNQLMQQYQPNDIIVILILVTLCAKVIYDLCHWAYTTLRQWFGERYRSEEKEKKVDGIEKRLNEIADSVDALSNDVRNMHMKLCDVKDTNDMLVAKIADLEKQENNLQEHFLAYTRAFIIDKYHYYCYQMNSIDDMSLQSIELCYLYYKAEGGDSFVDGLMERMRVLPRTSQDGMQLLEDGAHDGR